MKNQGRARLDGGVVSVLGHYDVVQQRRTAIDSGPGPGPTVASPRNAVQNGCQSPEKPAAVRVSAPARGRRRSADLSKYSARQHATTRTGTRSTGSPSAVFPA